MSRNCGNHSRLRWLRVSSGFALCFATVVLLLLSRAHAAPQQASVAGTSAASESRGVPGIATSPAFSARDLVAPPAENWLKVGGSLLSQNWSPLKQIDRGNVAKLKAVWQTHLDGSALANKYSGEAQPVVYEGVLYIVTGADDRSEE